MYSLVSKWLPTWIEACLYPFFPLRSTHSSIWLLDDNLPELVSFFRNYNSPCDVEHRMICYCTCNHLVDPPAFSKPSFSLVLLQFAFCHFVIASHSSRMVTGWNWNSRTHSSWDFKTGYKLLSVLLRFTFCFLFKGNVIFYGKSWVRIFMWEQCHTVFLCRQMPL